jgi:hypothetical protein
MTKRGLTTLGAVTQNYGDRNAGYGSVAHYDESSYAKCHFYYCSYAKRPYGERHFAECLGAIIT